MKKIIENINDIAQGSGCFRAGTLVRTPTGDRPIERFHKRDKVLCYDEHHKITEGKVSQIFSHNIGQKNKIITLENGVKIYVTANHWLLRNPNKFVEVSDLRVGDSLLDDKSEPVAIKAIEDDLTVGVVYNLKIFPFPTFIINGILAHNGGGGKGGASYSHSEKADNLFSIATARVLDLISEGQITGLVDYYENLVSGDEIGKAIYLDNTPILSENSQSYTQKFNSLDSFGTFGITPVRDWNDGGDQQGEIAMLFGSNEYISTGGTRLNPSEWHLDAVNLLLRNDLLIENGLIPENDSVFGNGYSTRMKLPVEVGAYYRYSDNQSGLSLFHIKSATSNVYPGSGLTKRVWTDVHNPTQFLAAVASGTPYGQSNKIHRIGRTYFNYGKNSFITGIENVGDLKSDVGQSWTGHFIAPVTGSYLFQVTGDDWVRLDLSTDDTEANLVTIASLTSACGITEWRTGTEQSGAISLTGGQAYYIQVLHADWTGNAHVGVRMKVFDGIGAPKQYNYIPSIYLSADPVRDNPWQVKNPDFKSGHLQIDSTVKNFRDVEVTYTSGVPVDQQVAIIGFAEPRQTVQVGVEVKNSQPWTVDINDKGAESVDLVLRFNGLMYTLDDEDTRGEVGDVDYATVDFTVYRNGVEYTTWHVSGKSSSSYQVAKRIPPPVPGQPWTLKIVRNTEDATKLNYTDKSYIEFYAINNNEAYSYPNTALIGVGTRADHFSRVPTRTYHVKGIMVQIPTGYDPDYRTYIEDTSNPPDFWQGTFKPTKAYTNNPAWIFYDLCTNRRYGLGNYITEDMINKWELYRCARYCDELVPTGETSRFHVYSFAEGATVIELKTPLIRALAKDQIITFVGYENTEYRVVIQENAFRSASQVYIYPSQVGISDTSLIGLSKAYEPRFEANLYYQTFSEAWKAMQDLASSFRAAIFWMDGGINLSQDRPIDSEHVIFNSTNVINGEFAYTGSDINDKYTLLRVQWNDPDNFDEPVVEVIEDIEGMIRFGMRTKSLTSFGSRSRTQAIRTGKWYIYTSLYESEIVSFTAGQEGLYTYPGRVILIHDSDRDNIQSGGRVVKLTEEVVGTHTVHFDREVEFIAGHSYELVLIVPTDYNTQTETAIEGGATETYAPQVQRFAISDSYVGEQVKVSLPADTLLTLPEGCDGSQLIWAVEDTSDTVGKTWKVISTSPNDDGTVTITAKRYLAEKFTETEDGPFVYRGESVPSISTEPLPPSDLIVNRTQKFDQNASKAYYELLWTPPQNAAVFGYEIAFSVGSGPRTQIKDNHTLTWYNIELTSAADLFYVRTINVLGQRSDWVTSIIDNDSRVGLPDLAPITGLELSNESIDGEYQDRNAEFVWRLNSSIVPNFGEDYSGTGSNEPYFDQYVIEIRTLTVVDDPVPASSDVYLNTYTTKDRNFMYSFESHIADRNRAGVPIEPSFKILVSVRNTAGEVSRPTVMEVRNGIPEQLLNFTATRGWGGVTLNWDSPANETDIKRYHLYKTLDAGYPDPETAIWASTTDNTYRFSEDVDDLLYGPLVDKYFWVVSEDIYGQTSTPVSVYMAAVEPPNPVYDLSAVWDASEGEVLITWSNPSPVVGLKEVMIQKKIGTGAWKVLTILAAVTGATGQTFTDPNVFPNKDGYTVTYKLTARDNTNTESLTSPEVEVVVPLIPVIAGFSVYVTSGQYKEFTATFNNDTLDEWVLIRYYKAGDVQNTVKMEWVQMASDTGDTTLTYAVNFTGTLIAEAYRIRVVKGASYPSAKVVSSTTPTIVDAPAPSDPSFTVTYDPVNYEMDLAIALVDEDWAKTIQIESSPTGAVDSYKVIALLNVNGTTQNWSDQNIFPDSSEYTLYYRVTIIGVNGLESSGVVESASSEAIPILTGFEIATASFGSAPYHAFTASWTATSDDDWALIYYYSQVTPSSTKKYAWAKLSEGSSIIIETDFIGEMRAYAYRIKVINGASYNSAATPLQGTGGDKIVYPDLSAPPTVANSDATYSVVGKSVKVTWDVLSDTAIPKSVRSEIRIFRSISTGVPGTYDELARLPLTATEYIDESILPTITSTNYYYKIQVYRSALAVTVSSEPAYCDEVVYASISAATSLTATSTFDGVVLAWTTNTDTNKFSGYNVYRRRISRNYSYSASGSWSLIGRVNSLIKSYLDDRFEHTIAIDNDDKFAYKIVPVDLAGTEDTSNLTDIHFSSTLEIGQGVILPEHPSTYSAWRTNTPFASLEITSISTTFDWINYSTEESLKSGALITFTTDGTLPTGLAIDTPYRVYDSSSGHFQVVDPDDSLVQIINLVDSGSGTHTVHYWPPRLSNQYDEEATSLNTASDRINFSGGHSFITGDWVQLFINNSGSEGTFGGDMEKNVPYYVKNISSTEIELYDDEDGNLIDIAASTGTVHVIRTALRLSRLDQPPVPEYIAYVIFRYRSPEGVYKEYTIPSDIYLKNLVMPNISITYSYATGTPLYPYEPTLVSVSPKGFRTSLGSVWGSIGESTPVYPTTVYEDACAADNTSNWNGTLYDDASISFSTDHYVIGTAGAAADTLIYPTVASAVVTQDLNTRYKLSASFKSASGDAHSIKFGIWDIPTDSGSPLNESTSLSTTTSWQTRSWEFQYGSAGDGFTASVYIQWDGSLGGNFEMKDFKLELIEPL